MNRSSLKNAEKRLSTVEKDGAAPQPARLLFELWDWIKSILLAFLIVFTLHQFVFNLSTVKGRSMDPTLQDGEWLFVNKISYRISEPERGDIVILKETDNESSNTHYLVKRVIGISGDLVEVRRGVLYINGAAVDEPYTNVKIEDLDHGPVKVQEGYYFVMGDNRHHGASKDSRSFGAVSSAMIQGRADVILWPPGKIATLTD